MTRTITHGVLLALISACAPGDAAAQYTSNPLPRTTHVRAVPVAPASSLRPAVQALRGGGPSNDACSDATPITLVAPGDCAANLVVGTNAGTVTSFDDPTCTTSEAGYADVWYSFNSGTYTEVLVTLDPGEGMGYWAFAVQTSCDPGSSVACSIFPNPSVPFPVAVEPNTDYLVRCFTDLSGGDPGPFELCVAYQPFVPAPVNDACDQAAPISVVDLADCGTLATVGTTLGAALGNDAPVCDFSNVGWTDVWYEFNAGTHDEVYITLTSTDNSGDLGFTVQSACDPGTELACVINPFGVQQVTLEPGMDYLVRCFNNLQFGTRGNFELCVASLPYVAPPANDQCADVVPEMLAVGSGLSFQGDVSGATSTNDAVPGSMFEGERIVWHAFTTTECADVVLSYCDTPVLFDNVYLVLSPGCPVGDDVVMNNTWVGSCDNGNVNMFFAQLPAGTYYLPVLRDYAMGSYGAYVIEVSAASCTAIPVNDQCADVVPVAIPTGGSELFEGTLTAATSTNDFEPGSIWEGSNAAVWHAFSITAECSEVTVSYCAGALPIGIVYYHLVTACPAASDSIAGDVDFTCANGNAVVVFRNLPAGTYYLPVMSDPTNNAWGPYGITVDVATCPLPPENDDCSGAMVLVPEEECVPVWATTLAATESMAPVLCGNWQSPAAQDVWFSFVATSTHHRVTVAGITSFDAVVELFQGGCNDLQSIDCADETIYLFVPVSEVIEREDLQVGATYHVRVYDFAASSTDPQFTICVETLGSTGLAETIAPRFGVFPNPNDGAFTLAYAGKDGTATIELFDVTGRQVLGLRRDLRAGQQLPLDLAGSAAAGTYVLRLTMDGVRSEQRVLVK